MKQKNNPKKQFLSEAKSSFVLPNLKSTTKQNSSLSNDDLNRLSSELQQGSCKLILYDNPSDLGFKTFSELMQSNTTWTNFAPKMQESQQDQSVSYGSSVFPPYLKTRLHFNQLQATQYSSEMSKQWVTTMESWKNKYLQGLKDQYRLPKVRQTQSEKQVNQSDDEKEKDEEEENKKLSENHSNIKLRNLKFFWYSIAINEIWKPSMREGTSLTMIHNSGKCYMYGGIGKDLFNDVVILDTYNWSWKNIGIGTGEAPQEGRFGHSATCYKKQIIIFGGEKKYNSAMKMRECYNDVRFYSPQDHSWKYIRTFGDIAEARRNHCAINAGRFLFIFGGINSYGKYLNDFCCLNLETYKWTLLPVENFISQGLAFSTAMALFKYEIKLDNPLLNYEYLRKKGKKPIKLQEDGIYIFGGKYANGEASNELRVIKLAQNPLSSKVLETKGIGPSARYMHTMNYFEQLNLLIITGGRDDSQEMCIKNDIFVLELESLSWVSVDQIGLEFSGICNHSAVFLETKLLIFGGYSTEFTTADLTFVEMDQTKTRLMAKQKKKQNEMVFSTNDIRNDISLKVFTMDTNQPQRQVDDPEKQKREKEIQMLSYLNFKSFLPIPQKETSSLLKEFKLKKEQDKDNGSINNSGQKGLDYENNIFPHHRKSIKDQVIPGDSGGRQSPNKSARKSQQLNMAKRATISLQVQQISQFAGIREIKDIFSQNIQQPSDQPRLDNAPNIRRSDRKSMSCIKSGENPFLHQAKNSRSSLIPILEEK